MLNLQDTFNGFEYNYTMRIGRKEYQGDIKHLFLYNHFDNAKIYFQHIENMTDKK